MEANQTKSFWSIIFAVFFGNFLAVMNTSTVNVAVPAFMSEFSVDLPAAQWDSDRFYAGSGSSSTGDRLVRCTVWL
jgi:hypothetical protein